jgi:signal transduction histidine kinase
MLGEFSEAISHRSSESDVELIVDATDVEYTLVKGDSSRLRQVLSNLVGNALKFTSKGEIVVRVAIEDEGEHDLRFLCSVTDTGIGIPKDKIDHLFDSFTQADSSTTRKYGGSGLGLAIVKQLCDMMGGSIRASSEQGVGSCFEFNVRLQRSEQSKQVMPSVDINGLSILVVDDKATHRDMLEKQLRRWGAIVEKAQSTQQAL